MYIPKINRFEEQNEIIEFICQNPFAIVINTMDCKPWATHVPVEIVVNADGNFVLHTHIAKANPQWKVFEQNTDVLVIFNGPHTYISASWYDYENVSTWNYLAVHVYGKVRVMEGEEVLQLLNNLVNRHESSEQNPVNMDMLSDKFMASHLKGIVAFEIKPEKIDAKKKLSQNRDEKNYEVVVEKLNDRTDVESKAVADAMIKNRKNIFK